MIRARLSLAGRAVRRLPVEVLRTGLDVAGRAIDRGGPGIVRAQDSSAPDAGLRRRPAGRIGPAHRAGAGLIAHVAGGVGPLAGSAGPDEVVAVPGARLAAAHDARVGPAALVAVVNLGVAL